MSEPIKSKRLGDLPGAPTPQNTPSTAVSSFANRAAVQPKVSTIKEEDAVNLVSNPALLSMIEGRLHGLVGAPSGYIESLPPVVKDRIAALKAVQAQHAALESQFQMELLELEKKYFAKYTPLYERRAEIVNGRAEPTEVEIKEGKEIEEAEKEELGTIDEEDEENEEAEAEGKTASAAKDVDMKGVPEFWLTALKNLGPVAETIVERDDEALAYLTDIRMEYLDKPGFSLVFEFDENPFFANKTLTKSYYYQEEPGYGGDFIYDRAEGTDIEWKSADTNLCARVEKRKQRNKHTKATRTVEKLIPTDSFFNFFDPPHAPSTEEEEDEESMDPELEERLEHDYQLGEEIKEKLIPRAVDWFTGAALAYEGLDDEFDEEDFEDSDEDDSDEDSDEDGSSADEDKAEAEKPECNQQ